MDALPHWFPLLAVVVFLAELCVVTLATIRIIFVSRGMRVLAALLGLFEITLWLFAIGQIMKNLTDVGCFIGFAAGFTLGNFVGIQIEKALAIGAQVVRIITSKDATSLIAALKSAGYGVTSIRAEGATGPVHLVFTIIKRKDLPAVARIIEQFDPKTFYSVEGIQHAAEGVFPLRQRSFLDIVPLPQRWRRPAA